MEKKSLFRKVFTMNLRVFRIRSELFARAGSALIQACEAAGSVIPRYLHRAYTVQYFVADSLAKILLP